MADFMIRNVPEELWRRIKHDAIDKGLTLRAWILEAIQAYLERGGK